MNKRLRMTAAMAAMSFAASSQATIVLDSLGSGSEGNTRFSDTTPLSIDGSGNAFDPNAGNTFEDFAVSGSVADPAAFNTNFSFSILGMADVNTTTGAKLADGGIDRANNGDLGVRGNSNGVDALEGLLLGIDATNLDPLLMFKISGVRFAFLGGDEAGAIVNRTDPSKSLTFGASGTGSDVELSSGLVDVTGLDLVAPGGTSIAEVASVFGGNFGGGSFRITEFQLQIVAIPEPSSLAFLGLASGLLLRPRRRKS
ncbi:MAG: hypothetical protein AAGJ46_02325 [Planctomycetota bacterium]